LKRRVLVSIFVAFFLLSVALSTAAAKPSDFGALATGTGIFIHNDNGETHTHYFVFSVSQANPNNSPQGKFNLVCKHDSQIETIIFSTQITSLTITQTAEGLQAVFSGSALVKMDNGAFQRGWTFTVIANDFSGNGVDSIGVTLTNPSGQVVCMAEPTPLTQGHIIINQ
jgi:hypothetical protein